MSLTMRAKHRRWSDENHHFGPFTYSRCRDGYKPLAIVLNSGAGENPGCHVRLNGLGHTLIIELPQVIKPWRQWVKTGHYEWAKSKDDGYWDEHSNEYGVSLSDGFLQVFLGAQTGDSTTTQNWCANLPWTEWRHIRLSFYDAAGKHFWTEWETRGRAYRADWRATKAAEAACPALVFEVEDHDGQRIKATTRIQEREWHFGTKWCKWLSWFRKPKLRRSLDIEFSSEVGTEKGSWKGGLIGTGIDMLPDELHESAFRRYCDQEHRSKSGRYRITFVGVVSS
jgi:hypothetical protein